MLKLHTIKSASKSKKRHKRRGRGNASRGNYSGRGMKGQRSRSGGKSGLKRRSLMRQLIEKTPKFKGFKSKFPTIEIVNLQDLERCFKNGDTVTVKELRMKMLIAKNKNSVKILGKGKLTHKLTVEAHQFSKSAKTAIEKAGGEIIIK